jgi:hypothetical protein
VITIKTPTDEDITDNEIDLRIKIVDPCEEAGGYSYT